MPPSTITLLEYQTRTFPADALPPDAMRLLHFNYRQQVTVNPPTEFNRQQWELTAQGYAGAIPLTPDLHFRLLPKVPVSNLFAMLAHTRQLDLKVLEGVVYCDTLDQFVDCVARALALGALKRLRLGLQREYVRSRRNSTVLRGKLHLEAALRQPWNPELPVTADSLTLDTPGNRIIAWTLWQMARSGDWQPETHRLIEMASRAFRQAVPISPLTPEECLDQTYSRLNQDYALLHRLCYFYLAHIGPGHSSGGQEMFPFLVSMEKLFEEFVAAWLREHLPPGWTLKSQESVSEQPRRQLHFRIDMVVYDRLGKAQWVIDTKYKQAQRADSADIQQLMAYAQLKGCDRALLIYPAPLSPPLDTQVNGLHLRSLAFPLESDLEQSGKLLLNQLTGLI
jgi:5-methylcytosine-specific restriction enzyme subunit McrC